MVRIIADDIDELYMIENWIECGILNTPVLNEKIYPGKEVEVNYDVISSRPHYLLRDNTWNQIAAVAYADESGEIELVKPFKEIEGITIENGKVILPPEETGVPVENETTEVKPETMEVTTDDSGTV